MRAYCFASGQIEFGNRPPAGAIVIAMGSPKALRAFIEVKARHGYNVREVNGRNIKIPGSDILLVPGVPEAPDQDAGLEALYAWCRWIGERPPVGVTMAITGELAPAPLRKAG